MRNKFEQLIEHIINDDTEKANELFHAVVVEKSREIYNELVAEDMDGMGNPHQSMDGIDDMMGDVAAKGDPDENGMDVNDDDEDSEFDGEHDFGDEEDEDGNAPATKNDIEDLGDALDDLKAQFERIMHDEAGEEEHDDMSDDGVVREYVEKVQDFYKGNNGEGQGVGAGSIGSATNTQSVVAGRNDMGGSNGNMTKGGSNPAPEGSAYKQPTSYPAKGRGNLPGAGKFENVPGANAGGAFNPAKKPASSEPSGVNKTSINLKP